MEASVRNVNIYLESNPNPNSLKFVVNFLLVPEGETYDFPTVEEAGDSPLALELFNYQYVERVFIMNNFVTVTKKEGVDWMEIRSELKEYIKNYLEEGKPVLEPGNVTEEKEEDPELVSRIKGVLEEYVKPAVEQDGGAIVFESFDQGTVKVALQGSCSGCPSSTITLKAGIENILTTMVPEVNKVEAHGV